MNNGQIGLCIPQPTYLDAPVKPETVTAYEVGYKGRLFQRLNFSFAAFHYLYKDIQTFVFSPVN